MVPYNKHKLSFKSIPCVFIGYDDHYKGYRCLDPFSGRIYISRNVTFDETSFPYKQPQNTSSLPFGGLHFLPHTIQPTPTTQSDLGPSTYSPQIQLPDSLANNTPRSPSPSTTSSSPPGLFSHNTTPQAISSPSNPHTPSLASPSSSPSPKSTNPPSESASPSPKSTNPLSPKSTNPSPFTTSSHMFFTNPPSGSTPPSSPIDPSILPNSPDTPNPPQKFKSLNSIVHFGPGTKPLYSKTSPHPLPHALLAECSDPMSIEPTSFTQASQSTHWRAAMKDEYDALMRNQTWSLVPATSSMNIVGCKWVFKVKRKADGSIDRYKARLVAKGFNQKEGFDYEETFSPVVKPATIRTILSIVVSYNWLLQQLDVCNAFLNGYLQEEAPRAWFQRLSTFLLAQRFVHSRSDAFLFIRRSSSCTMYVLIYGDNIIVTGSKPKSVHQFIDTLCSTFDSRRMGELNFFLGMEINQFSDTLFLSQTRYAVDLLKRFNMTECKSCPTPLPSDTRLSCMDGDPLPDPSTYRSMVGGLQYLTLSRPDISFAVNHVCQFMHNPRTSHIQVVKRILRYIKGTLEQGLIFHKSNDFTLRSFLDADWAGSVDDRRSTTGACIFLGPNLLTWTAKKQSTVSRSSTEAEYRALANTAAEIRWFGYLFRELGIPLHSAPCIYVDNISAIYMAANPIFHARTRHIEIDYHFVCELVARKALHTLYVPSSHQLADIFTKGLNRDRFSLLKSKLNLRVAPLRLREGKENHDADHDSKQSAHSMHSVDPTKSALTDSPSQDQLHPS
ncbi:unnamed protein product [Prunus armeniaca]